MKTISVDELNEMLQTGSEVQLIDVRELTEYETANIGGNHIPLAKVPTHTDQIKHDKKVVMICRSGRRSASAIEYLETQGYQNLYNLDGGLLAWKDEIDNTFDIE